MIFHPLALPGDVDLMVKMKTTIDTQRDEIREINQENERHKSEIDAVSISIHINTNWASMLDGSISQFYAIKFYIFSKFTPQSKMGSADDSVTMVYCRNELILTNFVVVMEL